MTEGCDRRTLHIEDLDRHVGGARHMERTASNIQREG